MTKLNMVKALNVALQQEMERDPDVLHGMVPVHVEIAVSPTTSSASSARGA